MNIVELTDVCKTYPSFLLKEVSFSLEKGKITGFIGRNGAGKTTTIKSMLNMIHTDSGEISYFGLPLSGNVPHIPSAQEHKDFMPLYQGNTGTISSPISS